MISVAECNYVFGKIVKKSFKHIIKNQPRRRQERQKLYRESSTIWATKYSTLLKNKSVIGKINYPIVVSKIEAIDINDEFDFINAEAQIKSFR